MLGGGEAKKGGNGFHIRSIGRVVRQGRNDSVIVIERNKVVRRTVRSS
jgi:hypothetical protein